MEDTLLRQEIHSWIINTNKTIAELREMIYDLEEQIRKDRIMNAMKDRSLFI